MGTRCIAIIGEKGAGKGHFVEATRRLLPQKRIATMRFSDPLRNILKILDKEITRENMQALATSLRNTFSDEGILNGAIRKYINEADADIIILDGVRKREEAALVRELGGILVYITASPEVRFERRRQHTENLDERNMSWEQFLAQENAATEISIRKIGETMAIVRIDNNGSIEEFENSIRGALFQIGT